MKEIIPGLFVPEHVDYLAQDVICTPEKFEELTKKHSDYFEKVYLMRQWEKYQKGELK